MSLFTDVPPRMAVCPRDGAPLISTLAFPKAEFYCLECGQRIGFLGPDAAAPTPELDARYESLLAEWTEHAGGKLLTPASWRGDCRKCKPGDPTAYHVDHATTAELEAHREALEWLTARISR